MVEGGILENVQMGIFVEVLEWFVRADGQVGDGKLNNRIDLVEVIRVFMVVFWVGLVNLNGGLRGIVERERE